MAVRNWDMTVSKNTEKSGAWLATFTSYVGTGEIDLLMTTAWTTAAAAKRWAAQQVGRSRLTWQDNATPDAKATKFNAKYSKRV